MVFLWKEVGGTVTLLDPSLPTKGTPCSWFSVDSAFGELGLML
jgi:hypothetical protein